MKQSLEGHMLAGRLRKDDKKIVRDLTKSLVLPKNILLNLKKKDKSAWQISSKYTMNVEKYSSQIEVTRR